MRSALLALVVVGGGACEISQSDPLPDIGATCIVADGKCSIEHACRPSAPGAAEGLCAPVLSFGTCEAPTFSAGREGTDDERIEVVIGDATSMSTMAQVRSTTGRVRVFKQGAERVDLPDLCGLRDLQRVGDGFVVADSLFTSLDGLQSLTSVAGGLVVVDNPVVTSLDPLANVVDVGARALEVNGAEQTFDVVIAGNNELSDDVADAYVAALEERAGRDLDVIACNNDGRACAGDDLALVQLLVATGGRGE